MDPFSPSFPYKKMDVEFKCLIHIYSAYSLCIQTWVSSYKNTWKNLALLVCSNGSSVWKLRYISFLDNFCVKKPHKKNSTKITSIEKPVKVGTHIVLCRSIFSLRFCVRWLSQSRFLVYIVHPHSFSYVCTKGSGRNLFCNRPMNWSITLQK